MDKKRFFSIVLIFLLSINITVVSNAFANREKGQVTGLKIPRFVSLKSNEVNLRRGPNNKYPIAWVYKRKGYPLELVAEFENWRKLRDIDGSEGWTHESLISGLRSAVVKDNQYKTPNPKHLNYKRELMIFHYPDETSYPLLRAEFGVLIKLKKCTPQWCKIKADGVIGWVRKENLWGVYADELMD